MEKGVRLVFVRTCCLYIWPHEFFPRPLFVCVDHHFVNEAVQKLKQHPGLCCAEYQQCSIVLPRQRGCLYTQNYRIVPLKTKVKLSSSEAVAERLKALSHCTRPHLRSTLLCSNCICHSSNDPQQTQRCSDV